MSLCDKSKLLLRIIDNNKANQIVEKYHYLHRKIYIGRNISYVVQYRGLEEIGIIMYGYPVFSNKKELIGKSGPLIKEKRREWIRTTIEGFLHRKYDIVRDRCNNPKNIRYENCKGRLNITQEDFKDWGRNTLPYFIKKQGIPESEIHGKGIELDRIENEGLYELGNIQWIMKKDHQKKSIEEGVWKNNEIKVKAWEIKKPSPK